MGTWQKHRHEADSAGPQHLLEHSAWPPGLQELGWEEGTLSPESLHHRPQAGTRIQPGPKHNCCEAMGVAWVAFCHADRTP